MADITLIDATSTTLHVPHVAQDSIWDTTVLICNPNSSSVTLTLTYLDTTGTADIPKNYTIAAMGSRQIDLSDLISGSTASSGKVKITAIQGVAAFAVYNNLKVGGYCYAGISAVEPDEGGEPESTQYESDKLFGYWHFWYTIISTSHQYYDLNKREGLNSQGDFCQRKH